MICLRLYHICCPAPRTLSVCPLISLCPPPSLLLLSTRYPYQVSASSLLLSVFTLMLMLLGVILTISLSGWKMTKGLGATMFFLYGLFLTWDLLRAYVISVNI